MKEYMETRRGYAIYREVVDGFGRWTAVKVDALGNDIPGTDVPITYEQARGLAPINSAEALAMMLGKALCS